MEFTKQITKEDINVYVLLRDFKYEIPWPNIKIGQEIEITRIKGNTSYLGYISYKYLSDLEKFIEYLGGDKTNLTVGEAFIPKGAEYYEGTQGWSFPISRKHLEITKYCSSEIKIKE